MKLFISAGEPSGDLHGANLIRALRKQSPDIEIIGFGGPRIASAGAELLFPLTNLASMGLVGLKGILQHVRLLDDAERCLRAKRPDAVVLIDYPEFNFVLAGRAKAIGIPVYYFVPPQIWAWRRGRVRQLRKWCDGVFSALPFEDKWFRSRRVPTYYVGHPYFDELAQQRLDPEFLGEQLGKSGRIVAILPGSRNGEVAANFAMMLAAAIKIHAGYPDSRFMVAAFSEAHAATIRKVIETNGALNLPIEVHVGRTPEIIELAIACIAVSGSVSLEIMFRAKPAIIVYRLKSIVLWLVRKLINLPFFTLVNLYAEEMLFPEIATSRDESDRISRQVLEWLNDEDSRLSLVGRLQALRDRVAISGACERTASYLLSAVEKNHQVFHAA
ncbi:MAG TPA: lipid-A-disaccharide synthase [Gemmata sp.]|jgi:lipid-A-disaccharide synthase|nr:lipid-A-disaccharide synthase [Gemmata sp.]